ncbi:MAG: prolipoprotein diacylglyceryl transferase [Planctomycetota bacterium]|jgi:phosphatidylglycerol:prolipoprotein diacylglycerol transferase
MYPELFKIPFTDLTVKSYGFMMVVGFLAAVTLIRRLSVKITPDPQLITNAALYSLIGGVIGARIFFVIHYSDRFAQRWIEVFYIWQGGLELLGGVVLAITVIIFYLIYHKLPVRQYLDILAVGLMLALVFGRIGCLLNGCCYGKPTDLPWGIRFPYYSFAYLSQTQADPGRNRPEPHLNLPEEYFGYEDENGDHYSGLKPEKYLTEEQKAEVTRGPHRCLPIQPTQPYSSAISAFWCLILYLFWRREQKAARSEGPRKLLAKPGCVFALMFICYGISRFSIEFLRDDNPFEFAGLTISQLIGIGMILLGLSLATVFQMMKAEPRAN